MGELRTKLGLRASNLITISPVTNSCAACNTEYFDFTLKNEKKILDISVLFCDILNIDIKSIPSTNPTNHLPFCPECLIRMSELLQLNLQLANLQSNFSELKAALVATVLDCIQTLKENDKIPNSVVRHIHRKIRDRGSPSSNHRNFPTQTNTLNDREVIPDISERSPTSYLTSTATVFETPTRNSSQLVEVTACEINDDQSTHSLSNGNDHESQDPLANVEIKLEGESDRLWDPYANISQNHTDDNHNQESGETQEIANSSFSAEPSNEITGYTWSSLPNLKYETQGDLEEVPYAESPETNDQVDHNDLNLSMVAGCSNVSNNSSAFEQCSICFKYILRGYDGTHNCETGVTGTVDLQCGYCDATPYTEQLLWQHLRKHMYQNGTSVCSVCNRRFNSISTLRRHIMKMHEPTNSVPCMQCLKHFPNEGALFQHNMTIHKSKDKRFHCQFCGKGFRLKNDMTRHTRIHTGEKPYQCSLCLKRFNRRHHLNSHVKTHLNCGLQYPGRN